MAVTDNNVTKIEITVPVQMLDLIKGGSEYDFKTCAMLLLPLIKNEDISYGKAAEILGINRLDLIDYYGRLGVNYIDYDIEGVEEDVKNALAFQKGVI